MNKIAAITSAALVVLALGTSPVGAEDVAPGGSNAFGQHVASMAPEHAIEHGADFGACVSTMARTGTCPHAH
jgi:hypothetical protein